jgi:hypothetical protein
MFSSNPKLKTTAKTQPRTRPGSEGTPIATSKSGLSSIPLGSVSSSTGPGLPSRGEFFSACNGRLKFL